MTQNPSNWNTILLGSSGVLSVLTFAGTYASYVFKQQVDTLKSKIDYLESDNTRLQKSLEEAKSQTAGLIESLTRLEFNDEDAARMTRIMSNFQKWGSLEENEFYDYKQAAQWIKDNKQDLIKEASKEAIRKHSKLFQRFSGKRKQFEKDIAGYLDWVYNSLNLWGHKNVPLREFVNQPIIKSPLPYIIAIRKLKDKVDVVELTVKQSRYLKDFLDGLIKKIPDEFRNS
jgi:actin-related protein